MNALGVSTKDSVLDGPIFNPWLFVVPALFEMTATCLLYFGSALTHAASFQVVIVVYESASKEVF